MYFIGVDLGQRQDFTAVAVVEKAAMGPMLVRHLERMALGMPYTKVVARVCEITRHPKLAGESRLVVDATGVGAPVVELLRAAGLAGRLTAVTITGGERSHGRSEEWHVPRKELLAGVEVLLDSRELRISGRLAETERLVRELTSLRLRGESGEHDDLAIALGLACWRAKKGRSGFGTARLPGI